MYILRSIIGLDRPVQRSQLNIYVYIYIYIYINIHTLTFIIYTFATTNIQLVTLLTLRSKPNNKTFYVHMKYLFMKYPVKL